MTRQTVLSKLSRRTVLQYGALASSGVLGATVPGQGHVTRVTDSEQSAPIEGAMFSYQCTPGGHVEVETSDVDWHPGRLEPTDRTERRTHVVRYNFSPSYRAFLFTTGDSTIHRGGRYELEMASARATGTPRLVSVDVVPAP